MGGESDMIMKGFKEICKWGGIVVGCSLIGVILLVMVYCLPIEPIFYNFSTGVEGMERNGEQYQLIFDYDASVLDMFTEALMVKAAATPMPPTGENVVQQAMRGYTLNERDVWQGHGLKFYEYEWNGKEYSCDSYERYWHGYLVILKPLMLFFSLHDIVFLNFMLQMIFMYFFLLILRKKKVSYLQFPMVLLWIMSVQVAIMLCLDYSVCFYIYMGAVTLLLVNKKAVEKYCYVFLLTGICTAYFDFLTWPLITLCIPMVILMCLKQSDSINRNIQSVIVSSLSWGFGYAGMWGMKWLIGSIVLQENLLHDAIQEITLRNSNTVGLDETITWLEVLGINFGVILKKPIMVLLLTIFIFTGILIVRRRKYCKYRPFMTHCTA